MTDIDKELDRMLKGIISKIDYYVNLDSMYGEVSKSGDDDEVIISDAYRGIRKLIEQAQLDLLSRIKEEVIGEDEAGGYSRGVQPVRNNLREKQRIKLDNIAKEIRGDRE